jgi:hypothetical protein
MTMSRKPSTAALVSFPHTSFRIRRRAPRHPAGRTIRLSSGHGFSHAAQDGHWEIHCHPERSEGPAFRSRPSDTTRKQYRGDTEFTQAQLRIIKEQAMNTAITNRSTHSTQIIFPALLRVTLTLLLFLIAVTFAPPTYAQTNSHRTVKTYPINRANAQNLQRWVNAGHDTWCRDPKLVAAHTLEQLAPGIADSTYELASQPVVRKLSHGRTAIFTYHSLDGQTTYRITLYRPPWLRPTAGYLNNTVWLPTRLEILTNATT